MNIKRIAGLSLLVLTVSACATSTGGTAAGGTATASTTGQPITPLSKADFYKIAVQEQARLKGVDVQWVHPPDEDDLAKYDLPASPALPDGTSN